jgi:hypothetical protein
METSWYLIHIRPEKVDETDEKAKEEADRKASEAAESTMLGPDKIPLVGTTVKHMLGLEAYDEEQLERDKKNPLWDKIQDEARPAWAPDFLRLGYAVVFKREGLPKLAAKLGIKNPLTMDKDERQSSQGRVLTFDDVLVIGVVPHMSPMYMPDVKLSPEEWWLASKDSRRTTAPYISPGGVTVATGAQRMADVVVQLLRSPEGYPRIVHESVDGDDVDDFSEFMNPLVPLLPKGPSEDKQGDAPDSTRYGENPAVPKTGYGNEYGWAGIELFRY